MAEEQKTSLPEPLRDLLNAVFKYERWAREEGYKAGWDAAVKHAREQLEKERAALPENPTRRTEGLTAQFAQFLENNPPKVTVSHGSANDVVLRAITERPGHKGVDLLAHARLIDPNLHERTFRTALHRLRHVHKKITNVEGRWYVVEDAPADPQADLMEAKMPPPDR